MSSCTDYCSGAPAEWFDSQQLDVGVTDDLRAVFASPQNVTAVGSNGVVVVWDPLKDTVSRYTIPGSPELRDVSGYPRLWTVGDAGFFAESTDDGATWTAIDLGTTANLYAVASNPETTVVVGDGVLMVHNSDGSISQPAPPPGGWGDLRDVCDCFASRQLWIAVGLGGTIWTSEDPANAWAAEASNTVADLHAVGMVRRGSDFVYAGGANGTLLNLNDAGIWHQVASPAGVTDRIVGVAKLGILTVTGDVVTITLAPPYAWEDEVLEHFESGAAFAHTASGFVVVGDNGYWATKVGAGEQLGCP